MDRKNVVVPFACYVLARNPVGGVFEESSVR